MQMETRNTPLVSSMVQTRSFERVLAPIAAQVSQLIILNESAETEGGKLPNLVPFAQQVLRATEDLAQVGQHLISQSTDEELCAEMPKACDRMKSTGRNVLMAVQRLQAEPHSDAAKENMVTAARRLLQATVKVLLVSDGAEVRRIIQAAHFVLDRLRLLQSLESMKALVVAFKAFTESVMTLSGLCDRRQQDLTQPQTKERILVAMDTLRKAVPTLSAAMQTYVKYHGSTQAKASRDFVISQVSSAIADIIQLMGSQLPDSSGDRDDGVEATAQQEMHQEEPGHFAKKLDKLIQLLSPNHRTLLDGDFYNHVGDVVRHSMSVSALSRDNLRQQITASCKQILKQRGLIQDRSEGIKDNPDFKQLRSDYDQSCEHLAKELLVLEKLVKFALIGQTVDAFVETVEPLDRMVKAATTTLKEKGPLRERDCVRILQPLEDTFHEHTDRMCQLGSFASASCTDMQRATNLLHLVSSLEQLDPEVFPACLAVRQDILDRGAVRHLKLIRREWQSEVQRLVEALDDLIDANRFMEVSESYMEDDLEDCRQAEVIADRDLLSEAANNLLGRAKRVIQVACNQVDGSEDPIFRNGLRVHIDQLEKAMTLVKNGAQKALSHFQLKRAHQQLTERGQHLLECVHIVAQAILGRDHPDILNPLREGVNNRRKQKAEELQDHGGDDAAIAPRLRFSNVNYLSKPLPASAGVLASDPAADLTDGLSKLKLSQLSPDTRKKAVTPMRLSYPMAGLMRALFSHDPDPHRVDRLCVEAENKSSFLASLATRASDCTQDQQLKGKLESQALQLISKTAQLARQAKASMAGTEAARTDANLSSETWTSLVAALRTSLMDVIGCWGLPGNKLMEESLRGGTDGLPKEIDSVNLHLQSVHRLIRTFTEALQAVITLNDSKMADSSTQVQLLQKQASDWTKLTHSLISAANETVINPDEPLLQDLVERRWSDWSIKQLELISTMDGCGLEASKMAASLATVTMEAGQNEVTEHVQRLKDYTMKMGHMADSLLSSCADSTEPEGLMEASQSLDKLSKLLSEAAVSCFRVRAEGNSLEQRNRGVQRVSLLQREWAAKAQVLATHIDCLAGDMTTPLDRLNGAALAVSQASGPSRHELLEEFQTQSDTFSSAVSGVRQACAQALRPTQAGPMKSSVFAAMDALCRLTPLAVTQARNIADGHPVSREETTSIKREWACNAKVVINGLTYNPEVMSSTVKDVSSALRCNTHLPASILPFSGPAYDELSRPLDSSGLSPHQISLLSTLPRQGIASTFAPRNHSTPSDHSIGPQLHQLASPSQPSPWQAALRASISGRVSSSPGGRDESDAGKPTSSRKSFTPGKEVDPKSPYRSRALGMGSYVRTPGLRSATSTPTLQAPRTAGGRDALNHTSYNRCSSSIAAAALVLQQETEKWEDDTNSIVKVAKTMSGQMYDMARYARKINNPAAKEEMINTAKAIAANGKVIYRFAEILAEYCLDRRVGGDLLFCAENIPSLCTQLSIIASVKTATPNDDTTDIVLMKNADNLMQAVLNTLKAAEAACVKGLRAIPELGKDEEEARALATQWRLRLDHHRQMQASCEQVDALGLRRLPRNISAPALTQILAQR
ncbi:uncharacterized protein LOC119739970 [Patiria miniata]|uniref:Vinculin n=1 Tax=Patiria miniata TaxID=46514 RepID=A0A914B546_PATMI|nr:uncharacterized protein LOC119739970 [Patiria miniata]